MVERQTVRKIVDGIRKKNPAVQKFGLLGDDGVQSKREVFSTTSLALDYAIAYGGIPRAKMTHIYGPERSLKTTIALKAGLEALNRHPEDFVVLVDFERNYDHVESKQHLLYLGYTEDQINNNLVYMRDVPEESFNALEELVQNDRCLVAVIDSIGGMISGRSYNKGFEENAKVGMQPVLISDMMKRLNTKNNNCAIVLINQARDVIGKVGYGGPQYKYSGGRTLKHLIHLSLDVHGFHKQDAGNSHNNKINLRTRIDKCKVGGENTKTTIEFNLETGEFNRALDCLTLGYELGIMKNSGAWYYLYDGIQGGSGTIVHKGHGSIEFEKAILGDPNLYGLIEGIVREQIQQTSRINWKDDTALEDLDEETELVDDPSEEFPQ